MKRKNEAESVLTPKASKKKGRFGLPRLSLLRKATYYKRLKADVAAISSEEKFQIFLSDAEVFRDLGISFNIEITNPDKKMYLKCEYAVEPNYTNLKEVREYLTNVQTDDPEMAAKILGSTMYENFKIFHEGEGRFPENKFQKILSSTFKLCPIQRIVFGLKAEHNKHRGYPCFFLYLEPKGILLKPVDHHSVGKYTALGIQVHFERDGALFIRPKYGKGDYDQAGKPILIDEESDSINTIRINLSERSITLEIRNERTLDELVKKEKVALTSTLELIRTIDPSATVQFSFDEMHRLPPIDLGSQAEISIGEIVKNIEISSQKRIENASNLRSHRY
jgi:hypothetical protein